MKSIQSMIESYFAEAGLNDPVQLGPGKPKKKTPTKELNEAFARSFEARDKLARKISIVAVILACLLFGGLLFLLLRYSGSALGLVVPAGIFGVLVWILSYLRRLAIDQNESRLTENVLRNLPPEQAAKFINEFYWNGIKPQSRSLPKDKSKPDKH